MDAPTKTKVLKLALLSRVSIFVLQFVLNTLIPDHEPDVFNPPHNETNGNFIDTIIDRFLGGFIRWDGVYFLHVAEYGYIYENSLAFFPLFPWSVRLLANSLCWPLQLVVQYRTVLILCGFTLNLFLHIQSTTILFRLSKKVLNNDFLAYQSAVLFCINPASIFMSAFYSETLFAYLTFSSMLMFENRRQCCSLLSASLGCITRSNGLLTAGFEIHRSCQTIFTSILMDSIVDKIVTFLKEVFKLLTIVLLLFLPFVVYQFYISDIFCKKRQLEIPDTLIQYGQKRGYNLIGNHTFDWCKNRLPFAYSHVQNTHWNVGFLRYYEFRQIPNFILALPVSYLSMSSVLHYYRLNRTTCLTLGLLPDKGDNQTGLRRKQLLPYVAYLLFITLFGWCFIHIQVLTRMVFSSSPVVYWYAAVMVSTNQKSTDNKHYYINKDCDIIFKILHFFDQDVQSKFVISYFLGYFVIGTFMFSNFLPWT